MPCEYRQKDGQTCRVMRDGRCRRSSLTVWNTSTQPTVCSCISRMERAQNTPQGSSEATLGGGAQRGVSCPLFEGGVLEVCCLTWAWCAGQWEAENPFPLHQ